LPLDGTKKAFKTIFFPKKATKIAQKKKHWEKNNYHKLFCIRP
jgi:hypothetical protein